MTPALMRVPVDTTPVAPPGVRSTNEKRKPVITTVMATSPIGKSHDTVIWKESFINESMNRRLEVDTERF